MKLYHHKTDGGAEYLTDKYIICPSGHKEGIFEGAKYIVRIDGDITKDAELSIGNQTDKKDLAKYLADYINYEKDGEGFCPEELCGIIEQGLDAFESTQEKVVTITEGGE